MITPCRPDSPYMRAKKRRALDFARDSCYNINRENLHINKDNFARPIKIATYAEITL